MKTVIAIIFNQRNLTKFSILDKIKNYRGLTEVILYGNNISLPPLESSEELPITLMESEVELDLDRVYRQILSYVHQSYEDGKLLIFDGSDSIPDSDEFLDEFTGFGVILKCNCLGGLRYTGIKSLDMRLIHRLAYPFGFVPVFDISNLKYALTSRDLYSFVKYITEMGPVIELKSYEINANLADAISLTDKYGIQLINELDFDEESGSRSAIKFLLNRISNV